MPTASSLAQKKAALKQLSATVFRTQEALSYIDAGFLLRSHLEDFVAGVYFLITLVDGLSSGQIEQLRTVDQIATVDEDLCPTLRRLCQLSREVTFAVDPNRLTPELRDAIEKLFRFAADQTPEIVDQEAVGYLENIRARTLQPILVA